MLTEKSWHSLCAGPPSLANAPHFESSSDEIRQPVSSVFPSPAPHFLSFSQFYPSAIPLLEQLPVHVAIPCQTEVNQLSTEQKANTRTRSWNTHAIFRDVWRRCKREKPLGKSPGVRKSIIAIFKSSCEHPPVGMLPPD